MRERHAVVMYLPFLASMFWNTAAIWNAPLLVAETVSRDDEVVHSPLLEYVPRPLLISSAGTRLSRCVDRRLLASSSTSSEMPASQPSAGTAIRLRFTKVRGTATDGAVIDVGEAGSFDAAWVTCPSVVFLGHKYQMWYSSYYDAMIGAGGIGLAESLDGVHWRRRSAGKPVLAIGESEALDNGQVLAPEVLYDGEKYQMWYTGSSKKRHSSGFVYYRIFLATSRNGLVWTRANEGKPVLDIGPPGAHDEVQAATPSILREGDRYRMWYAAWSPDANHTICVANSIDGIHWTRENGGKPIEGLSPSIAYGPAICRLGDRYLMLYMALRALPGLYGATSRDGTQWTMLNDGSPVLSVGEQGAFDGDILGHPFVLPSKDRIRVWYSGYRREAAGAHGMVVRIGLAEASMSKFMEPSRTDASGTRPG